VIVEGSFRFEANMGAWLSTSTSRPAAPSNMTNYTVKVESMTVMLPSRTGDEF